MYCVVCGCIVPCCCPGCFFFVVCWCDGASVCLTNYVVCVVLCVLFVVCGVLGLVCVCVVCVCFFCCVVVRFVRPALVPWRVLHYV